MYIEQISVFIENRTGRLADFTQVLADEGIDIKGICVTDTVDYGILRCICNDPEKATRALNERGFTASVTKVLGIEIQDVPGGLNKVMQLLKERNISLDYIYSINKISDKTAGLIIKVGDPAEAARVLREAGVGLYDDETLRAEPVKEEKVFAGKLRDILNESDSF